MSNFYSTCLHCVFFTASVNSLNYLNCFKFSTLIMFALWNHTIRRCKIRERFNMLYQCDKLFYIFLWSNYLKHFLKSYPCVANASHENIRVFKLTQRRIRILRNHLHQNRERQGIPDVFHQPIEQNLPWFRWTIRSVCHPKDDRKRRWSECTQI